MPNKFNVNGVSIHCDAKLQFANQDDINRLRHSILSSAQTLTLMLEDLQNGYHFDDADAALKIAAICTAVRVNNDTHQFIAQLLSEQSEVDSL